MKWWMVCLGMSLLALSGGLAIGLFILKSVILDIFLSYFIIMTIFTLDIFGIVITSLGLRK